MQQKTIAQEAADILTEAAGLINGPRNDDYGCFLENASIAAEYAGVSELEAIDVMIGFKYARLKNSPKHHDSIVDKVAYTALREIVRLRLLK